MVVTVFFLLDFQIKAYSLYLGQKGNPYKQLLSLFFHVQWFCMVVGFLPFNEECLHDCCGLAWATTGSSIDDPPYNGPTVESWSNNVNNASLLSSNLFQASVEEPVLHQRSHSQLSVILVLLTSSVTCTGKVWGTLSLKFEVWASCSFTWGCYC